MHETCDEHDEEIRRRDRIRRLGQVAGINAGMFVFTCTMAAVTGVQAFISDAPHEGGDAIAHGSRYMTERTGIDQSAKGYQRIRWGTMLGLSAISGLIAAKHGIDIYDGVKEQLTTTQEVVSVAGAAVMAGGNIIAHQQIDGVIEHSHASQDSHHHTIIDMYATTGLAGTIIADALGVDGISQWGGLAFASYTAFGLFPTKQRLNTAIH